MALINDFMSLIYPVFCESCSRDLFKHEVYVCNLCKVDLPRSNFHKNSENELSGILAGRIPFDKAMSLFVFEKKGRVQNLLHAIKYKKQKELAEFLGKLYAEELYNDKAHEGMDVIIPIPLHQKRIKERGFNQSFYFAKGLSSGLNLPVVQNLVREKETSSQTRKKKFERWENVEGIFDLKDADSLEGKHILLVDDVITTGATLEAAWNKLKEVEGIKISLAAIAFAKKL
jgi:ComF family protein